MKLQIMQQGPIVIPVRIYDEWLVYKSGVFSPSKTGQMITKKRMPRLQMVKVIGWGVEDETPYWLFENSWGTDWGEGGFGKIAIVETSEDERTNEPVDDKLAFVSIPSN